MQQLQSFVQGLAFVGLECGHGHTQGRNAGWKEQGAAASAENSCWVGAAEGEVTSSGQQLGLGIGWERGCFLPSSGMENEVVCELLVSSSCCCCL